MSGFRPFSPPSVRHLSRRENTNMINSTRNHGAKFAASTTLLPAPRQAHLPTSGPTTIKLTALLTHLLTHAPSNSTPNSTPNRTICARSSRARRNRRRAIALRQKPSHHARRKSWGLRLNPIPTSVSPSVSGRSSPDSSLLRRCYRQGPHFTGDCTCDW